MSSMGRFLNPDWAAKPIDVPYANFGDPQTLNLYAYAENGPLNRVDADGHAGQQLGQDATNLNFGPNILGPSAGPDQPSATPNETIYVAETQEQQAFASAGNNIAQQQTADPTLPTIVSEPKNWQDEALKQAVILGITDGLGELAEAGAALARAVELSGAMGDTARWVTIGVTETKEGTAVVSSSENALRPAVKALLKDGEIAAKGTGHAEVTGINAAKQMGLTPTGVAASRGICPSCAEFLRSAGVAALSALKETGLF